MKSLLLALGLLSLTGCMTKVTLSSPETVYVSSFFENEAKAQRLAQEKCAWHNTQPVTAVRDLTERMTYDYPSYKFNCVTRTR